MKTAIVFHSILDAEHCINHKFHLNNILLSTHSSVDVYLKEKYNLDCQCLSSFMSIEELIKQKNASSIIVDDLLSRLDYEISPILNAKFKLRLNYFVTLYSYMGKFHFLLYTCLRDCIRNASELLMVDKIIFYDYHFNCFMETKTDMRDIVLHLFGNLETDIIRNTEMKSSFRNLWVLIFERARMINPHNLKRKFAEIKIDLVMLVRSLFNNYFCKKKRVIVLTGPLHELEFIKKYLKKYNIFNPIVKSRNIFSRIEFNFETNKFSKEMDNPVVKLFLQDIKNDFIGNIESYVNVVNSLKEFNNNHDICLSVWGVPPVWKVRSLIYEYLKSENIKILGAEHGCLYGENFEQWHFNSDFNRCDFFLSYGFTNIDLERLYPTKKISVKILPVGKIKFAQPRKKAKKIDLVFPITNSVSVFRQGMARVPPHELTLRQIALLEYLNSLEDFKVYVKPFVYSNQENCSTFCMFNRLKNLHIVDTMTFSEFLVNYSPRAVLIEYPSQPLFDAIHLDSEIFLIGDPVIPYEKIALEELTKRVHYSEDIDGMILKLRLFFTGRLEIKRDSTFYNHYVYKEDTRSRILETIDVLSGL